MSSSSGVLGAFLASQNASGGTIAQMRKIRFYFLSFPQLGLSQRIGTLILATLAVIYEWRLAPSKNI